MPGSCLWTWAEEESGPVDGGQCPCSALSVLCWTAASDRSREDASAQHTASQWPAIRPFPTCAEESGVPTR